MNAKIGARGKGRGWISSQSFKGLITLSNRWITVWYVLSIHIYPMDSIIQPLNNCIGSIPIVCPSFSFWGRVGESSNGKQKTATQASYGLQNIEIASYSRLKANKMEHNTQILYDKQITIQRAFIYSINWWTSVSSWSVTWSRNRMVKKLFSGDCAYRKISFV